MHSNSDLVGHLTSILRDNDRKTYTVPAGDLYPHQWLWDSCFIAVGLRHLDIERAKMELLSLLDAQWGNGMLPHIIFNDQPQFKRDREAWQSWRSPHAPTHKATSGITQPPLLAEAVVQIGKKLRLVERRSWYRQVWSGLLAYHEWLYTDRDPHGEGLVLLVHPWETGLDNTPPWMRELHDHALPDWIRVLHKTHADQLVNLFRRDTRSVPLDERLSTIEVLALYDAQLRLRRKNYSIGKILNHALFTIEDLAFNSILIRANTLLTEIAKTLGESIPEWLELRMHAARMQLENLWDEVTMHYYSRDFITHRLLPPSTIASLLPLYAGTISKERAAQLVKKIEDPKQFGLAYPLPSVPVSEIEFNPKRYWQGPTWINMNWLVMQGLERYGYADHAQVLREVSIELVNNQGSNEYFDPQTGAPLGAQSFSWTAALTLDMLLG
jgi:hypothetical protein